MKPSPEGSDRPAPWLLDARIHLAGFALFLFIPLVLYLFVARPEPLGPSLAVGVALMLGHRRIARPYMQRAAPYLCLWTHRRLEPEEASAATFVLETGAGPQPARALARHGDSVARFFTALSRLRPLLAAGIFAPLALLLFSTAWVAAGGVPPLALDTVTAIFQLAVGVTVNVAAYAHLLVRRVDAPLRVPVPAHNFFLLGIRALLVIFRVVGTIWIVRGLMVLTA